MAQLDRDLGGRQPTRVGIVRRAFLSAVLVCLAYCPSVVAGEGEYLMRVQAWNAAGDSRAAFQPLADYLARRVGESVRLAVAGQVLEHWQRVRDQGGGDVVIDEAHFADYRVRRFGYRVIAKVSGLRGFSVLARPSAMILEPEDLWAKRVASLPAPSLAAVKLIELFPDAIRTPRLVAADSYADAMRALGAGRVEAAIVPSELAADHPAYEVVLATEEVPRMAVSVSPRVDSRLADAIRDALLAAEPDSRALSSAGLPAFEVASDELYEGYARLLRGTWGF